MLSVSIRLVSHNFPSRLDDVLAVLILMRYHAQIYVVHWRYVMGEEQFPGYGSTEESSAGNEVVFQR